MMRVARRAVLLACVATAGCSRGEATTLTVGAAASLTDVLQAIGRDYEASHPGVSVEFRFGASSLVARQIREGAPADLFFSANSAHMDALAAEGLILTDTRRDVLSNRLVVIAPAQDPLAINAPEDILQVAVKRIAVCDPATPIGGYTKAYLEDTSLYARAAPRFITFADVRGALAAVDGGNVQLGFVYQTDAAVARISRVVLTVPEGEGPRIRYPVAVVKATRHAGAARTLLDYLTGPEAAKRYREFGFTVLEGSRAASRSAGGAQ